MGLIQIQAKRESGHRRCNFLFGPEWTTFEDGYFSKDEMEILEADPKLSVRKVDTVPTDTPIHARGKADDDKKTPAKKAENKKDDGGGDGEAGDSKGEGQEAPAKGEGKKAPAKSGKK